VGELNGSKGIDAMIDTTGNSNLLEGAWGQMAFGGRMTCKIPCTTPIPLDANNVVAVISFGSTPTIMIDLKAF
jgi:hypothetical protein